MSNAAPERELPSRRQALVFHSKVALLQARRGWQDLRAPVPRHGCGRGLQDAPLAAESSSVIWNHQSPTEFPLTAGKVQNLRIACRDLHGLEIPAGETFSFWKQIGRTTKRKGYTEGRELREGCLVANIGGGICQLSNLLYNAALDAGLEIIERHPHSRLIPGSLAELDRDATIFWNYVDLRFRAPFPFRLETILTATEIKVRIRANPSEAATSTPTPSVTAEAAAGAPVRSNPSGDCQTCGMTSCFRHPLAVSKNRPSTGHTAFLLDEYWPEFQGWCRKHSQDNDRWSLPLDGDRWKKGNYAWLAPESAETSYATLQTLISAFRTRRLPKQGPLRQRALLKRDQQLAKTYGHLLEPTARHLVVAQNLLPHLWKAGVLGGRSFDVIMTRWPLGQLQTRLDQAAQLHPESSTLSDFRLDSDLVALEAEALTAAARIVTPHRAIAAHFGAKALLLDWHLPRTSDRTRPVERSNQIFFPASPLGRKGVFELGQALQGLDLELLVLGSAQEEGTSPLAGVTHHRSSPGDLYDSRALVLPAWIEHQPRIALRALANGIPVIATSACGLPEHPMLSQVEAGDSDALHAKLEELLTADAPTSSGSR